jgi:LuxR family transcriptional regulator, maltose regulon positive regulatory protein
LAGSMLTRVAVPRMQTTDRRALAAALGRIPSTELGLTAELQLCAASVSMIEGHYSRIGPHLEKARAMLEADPESDPSAWVTLALFEASLARARGAAGRTLAAADEALGTLDRNAGAVPLAQEYRAIALNLRGVGLLWTGDTSAATETLVTGMDACAAAGVELTLVNDLGHLGLAAAVAGRPRQAEEWAGRCLTLATARGWGELPQAAAAYLTLALVAVAHHDLDEAQRQVSLGMATQRPDREVLLSLGLRTMLATVDTIRGRYDSARSQLTSIRADLEATEATEASTLTNHWLVRAEGELALASGAHADLRRRLESLAPARRSADETLLLARARLVEGDADWADQLLVTLGPAQLAVQDTVEASLVRALCADRLRRDNEALEHFDRALSGAAAEHLVAPFVAAGTGRVRALLERVVLLRTAHAGFARTLLDTLEPADTATSDDGLVEPVTEREKTVLRYLATMLSNAEIAEQMFLSPNTVKVHLRHVYRKLDVTSRRAAVRRARELHLLDDDDLA